MSDLHIIPLFIFAVAVTTVICAFLFGIGDNNGYYQQKQIFVTNKICDNPTNSWYDSFYVFDKNGIRFKIETGSMTENYNLYKYIESGNEYCVILNNGQIKQVVGIDPRIYLNENPETILTIYDVSGRGIVADDGVVYGDGGYRYPLIPGGKYKVIVNCDYNSMRPQIKMVTKVISYNCIPTPTCNPTPICTPTPTPTPSCGCES